MKKIKKLILTTGIFSSSLFFNQGYAQEKEEYYTGNPNDPKSEIKRISGETWVELNKIPNNYSYWMKDAENKNGVTKWYIVPKNNPPATPAPSKTETGNYNTKYGTYNTKKEYSDKQGVKRVTQYSNPKKTYYVPPKTNNNSNLEKTILTTGAIIGGALILNELLKPRNRTPVYSNSAPPVNNPPTNYNPNPESNVDWWKENKESNKNWWSDETSQKNTENKNWWEENKTPNSNKIKSIEEALKEEQRKKADAEEQAIKTSRELSDFVEKQAGASPETKVWFDKEYQEAEEFYKEFYKNDPKAYAETQKLDKLHKIIGYNSYKLAKEYTPAGQALEGMEIYENIKEKDVENYWKDEVKKADEFLKQYEQDSKLKNISNEKNLEEKLNTNIYVPKFKEDKYSGQINKVAYESDVSKVIRYRAYQYAKNYTEAGKVIEGIEKVDEIKKNNAEWWGE